jgi:hypothetical protein
MPGCFAEFTLSEMKKILRLRLRMTANGISMTGSKVVSLAPGYLSSTNSSTQG